MAEAEPSQDRRVYVRQGHCFQKLDRSEEMKDQRQVHHHGYECDHQHLEIAEVEIACVVLQQILKEALVPSVAGVDVFGIRICHPWNRHPRGIYGVRCGVGLGRRNRLCSAESDGAQSGKH